MDEQIINKILESKNRWAYSWQLFNINNLGFDNIEDKHALYSGKDCMKRFCISLREHAKNIIDFEKRKMLPLTEDESKSHQEAKVCYVCGKGISKSSLKA